MAANKMVFVPMTSIEKKPDKYVDKCSKWVATEKVHGSSFQLFTKDGSFIHAGSRRRRLENDGSFLKCSIQYLLAAYQEYAQNMWHIIHSEKRWNEYRQYYAKNILGDDEEDEGNVDEFDEDGDDEEKCYLRIYGELYGGGGIEKDVKSACQKEIIYCDEFRFYVFGATINYKWVTIAELNDLCEKAGFPYYAKPIGDPKSSPDELIQWLKDNALVRARSTLTEKEGDENTNMEGVVMTPLERPDYRLHAVKFLFPAFNDVRVEQFGKSKTTNFCTKQRYHSVISKLDIHERQDAEMVEDLFIADIIKDSGYKQVPCQLIRVWKNLVRTWLAEDDYCVQDESMSTEDKKQNGNSEDGRGNKGKKGRKEKDKKKEVEEEEDQDMGFDLFDV